MKFFVIITCLIWFIAGYIIFAYVPVDVNMGIVQKIMYLHVPVVFAAYINFFICFVMSIGYLWKKTQLYDIYAGASGEIGVIFCMIVLLTGSIWGKPTWNTYWTWDARLTTTFVLFLFFVAYLLLRAMIQSQEQKARLSAVVAILGFLNIPLVHQSVTWWRTLHQPSTLFSPHKSQIDTPLLLALLVSMLAMFCLSFLLLYFRVKLEKRKRNYDEIVASLLEF